MDKEKKVGEVKAVKNDAVDDVLTVRNSLDESVFKRTLKYYHGNLKGHIDIVKDNTIATLNLCREVRKILGEMSENGVNKISELAFEVLRLHGEHDGLKSSYEDLTSEYEDMKVEYEDMKVEYEGLKEKFADLADENDALRERLEKTLGARLKRLFHLKR